MASGSEHSLDSALLHAAEMEAPDAKPCAVEFDEKYVFWAMRNLPVKEAVKHFLVCGAIGTGKTTSIDLFLQSIAKRFVEPRETPEQLIVFDAKCDIIPKLAAWGIKVEDDGAKNNVWLLNPYDERTAVWDIAEAVESPLMARHFAALLVPEEHGSSAPFFWTASRQLVYAVILGLGRIPGKRRWDLRDLLCALVSKERIMAVASMHPRAGEIAASILGDDQHYHSIISTLSTKIGPIEEVAALWHNLRAERPFSIKRFLERPGVLILGNDPVLRESLWPITAMLLKSLTKEILRKPNFDGPRYWFVLDEFTAMERVDSIQELVNRGRSKGASILVGIQGIDRLNQLYGETGANDLLEQCASKTFLRAGGPTTARWIESFFGQYRDLEENYSRSHGKETSTSVKQDVTERNIFLGSYFMNLPFTGPGRPFVAVNDVPSLGKTFITRRRFDEIVKWLVVPNDQEKADALRARDDIKDQTLNPWDPADVAAFCPPIEPESSPEPSAEPSAGGDSGLPTRASRFSGSKKGKRDGGE